ncbi:hypothetical protein RY963_002688 [Stenotrophomonas maltophilia]|nr:hypothetical protein [Stenotrophomonas maltophilia]ELN2593824.1 hypothetical protein [Stenotrophomonas maltophilia]MBH1400552.1 hypothetical protein [Stenotrophomonas maltophilia]
MTKERPILFNGTMVRAILAGAKTQTRRAIKPQPLETSFFDAPRQYQPTFVDDGQLRVATSSGVHLLTCPFGQRGDRLWVRERFKPVASGQVKNGYGEVRYGYAYEADSSTRWNRRTTTIHDLSGQTSKGPMQFQKGPWKSAICMPHRACRLVLEVTDVRVERLQAITEANAIAEGIRIDSDGGFHVESGTHYSSSPIGSFASLWSSTGGDWASNPCVWAITFKRIDA